MINKLQIENRIKYYRVLLNITQSELAFKDISLAQIKLLERRKRKLTKETSKIIANNINTIAKEKKLNIYVSSEKLLMSEMDLAYSLCKYKIENLDYTNKMESEIQKIIEICDEYSLSGLKMELFKNKGDYYVTKGNYIESIESYKIALEIAQEQDIELNLYLLNRIGACYHELGDLTLSIKNYTISENLFFTKLSNKEREEINPEILLKLYYGQAVIHNKLTEYKTAINYINKILNLKDINKKIYINTKMLLGNIYFRTQKIDEAIQIYTELNKVYPNNYNIQVNLISLYESIGDEKLSRKIFKEISFEGKKNLNFAVVHLLKKKSILIKKDKEKALKYLNKAFYNSLQYKSIDSIIKVFNDISEDLNNNLINIEDLRIYLSTLNKYKTDSIFNNNSKQRLNRSLIKLLIHSNIDTECKNIISNIIGGD